MCTEKHTGTVRQSPPFEGNADANSAVNRPIGNLTKESGREQNDNSGEGTEGQDRAEMGTSEAEQRRVLQGDEDSVEKQVGNPVKVVALRNRGREAIMIGGWCIPPDPRN